MSFDGSRLALVRPLFGQHGGFCCTFIWLDSVAFFVPSRAILCQMWLWKSWHIDYVTPTTDY